MSSEYNKYYLIYRISDDGYDEDFYGWTINKSIAHAFLKQRNKRKYTIQKIELDENNLNEYLYHRDASLHYIDLRSELMIDILPLKSCNTGDTIKFFTTAEEKQRIESDIRKMFDEMRSFDKICTDEGNNIVEFVEMYNRLDPKYTDALNKIGYTPLEVEFMYDSVEDSYEDFYTGMDCISFDPDDGLGNSEIEVYYKDLSKVVIYSLESVVKVLKNDL